MNFPFSVYYQILTTEANILHDKYFALQRQPAITITETLKMSTDVELPIDIMPEWLNVVWWFVQGAICTLFMHYYYGKGKVVYTIVVFFMI